MTRKHVNPTTPAPTAQAAKPKPELVTPAEPQKTERAIRLEAYEAEAKQLYSLKRFHKLEEGTWDGVCVLALADLFTYAEHDSDLMDDAPNWLGAFLSEILLEVAAQGPEWINSHPEYVKHEFDRAIENLRDSLKFSRRLQAKIPLSALDEIDKWHGGAA